MVEAQENTNRRIKYPVTKFSFNKSFFFRRLHLSFYRNEREGSYTESTRCGGYLSCMNSRGRFRKFYHLL